MENRIGFVGVVIENMAQTARVNEVIGQYQHLISGRIGLPDHENGMAVIGLVVRGDSAQLGAMTGKLGNIQGVTVKSAMTSKTIEKKEQ